MLPFHFFRDLRFAARMLAKAPGFTAVSVLCLALGIGANSTAFSLVDGYWTRPRPVRNPRELVYLYTATPRDSQSGVSYAEFLDYQARAKSFSGLLATERRGGILAGDGFTDAVQSNVVSDSYFQVLGIGAQAGRVFTPADAAGGRVRFLPETARERAHGMPGVLDATLALRAPLSGSGGGLAQSVTIDGHAPQPGDTPPRIKYTAIGPNYFRTLGIALQRGRDFDSHDQPDAGKVMIVNLTMARRFWPNQDALGKTVRLAGDPPNTERTVVGVVSDTRINSIDEPPAPYFYLPFVQTRFAGMYLIARTSVDPVNMARQVRAEVAAIDPAVPVLEITSMKLLVRSSVYRQQVSATMLPLLSR